MANDEIVRGMVELYVPSTRHISGIRVRLKAVQTIAILDPASGLTPVTWEDSTVLEKVVEIGIQSDKEKSHHNHHHHLLSFNNRSASVGPGLLPGSSSHAQQRGRSAARQNVQVDPAPLLACDRAVLEEVSRLPWLVLFHEVAKSLLAWAE